MQILIRDPALLWLWIEKSGSETNTPDTQHWKTGQDFWRKNFKKNNKSRLRGAFLSHGGLSPVLGIRDILVRIQILGSVTLTNGSGSGMPRNIRILRIRMRIRNTGKSHKEVTKQKK
jgi:hypothetical protein